MNANHVTVVGAGPAGLMAAEVLATAGVKVTIIDHHKNPARKFLLAGRGGLNLTHNDDLDHFLKRYSAGRDMLEPAIKNFPPEKLRDWCHGLGIETFVGTSGRVFPKSLKASPVLRAWLRRLDTLGVKLQSETEWKGFDDQPTILALGGASWPELGSNAAWVKIFETAGVKVNPLKPSNGRQLVNWSEFFAARFAGQPLKNVKVTVGPRSVRGEVMITKDGIEGGAVYALSPEFREHNSFTIDLKPDLNDAQVAERLAWPKGKESRTNFLRKALGLTPAGISLLREGNSENPKSISIETRGAAEINRAISTAGGVASTETDANFRLKKFPKTYVIGEMLDWDAPTGGFLLQACFSTAVTAAQSCLADLARK